MNEQTDLSQAYLDEPLASFTDTLLNGPAHAGSMAMLAEEEELRRLQHVVHRLHTAFGPPQPPNPAMAARIQQNLKVSFKENLAAAPRPSLLERLRRTLLPAQKGWQSGQRSQRVQVLRYAMATVAVLVLLALIVPATGTVLTGTALGEGGILPYAFLGIMIIAVAIWFWRSKPK